MRMGLALGALTGLSGTEGPAWGEEASSLVALSLTEASRKMRAKAVTSVQLTRAYLDRIRIYNPKLNAFITVMYEQAMEQAEAMDAEARAGTYRGPLHGLPIVLKDNIDTKGTRTTAASEIFDDRVPEEDAFVTMRLKQAGAVILGKANLHEFAMGHTSATTYWGPVRNPWALDRTPAGSSGGCGVAVISDLCLAAVGTDTGGSVRMPAAYCSMVGLKQPVKGLRLGVPRAPFFDKLDPQIETAVEAAIEVLKGMTASVKDVTMPATNGLAALSLTGEVTAYHEQLLRRGGGGYSISIRRNLQSGVKGLDDVSDEPCSEKVVDYVQSNWKLIETRKTIDDAFTDFDLLVLPTMRLLQPKIVDMVERDETPTPKPLEPERDNNCQPFDVWGIPAISIPCGFSKEGLPIGLMIAGPRFSEGRVLALAHAYEQATQWHTRRPALTPTMEAPSIAPKKGA
jgi:aspartyl-tRNA(Asn)/glutamyl-tRNA(Gln) amidotransferase subunit A